MAKGRETLKAAPRSDFGSRTSRRLRREGLVPGVVYSGGSEARAFQVAERDVRNVLGEGAALFDLEIEGGKAVPVVVKEQQLHPVRGSLQHIDLQEVRLDEAIQAEVAIELEGTETAPGVKGGGVLEHVTREVTVEALPTEIPDRIVADVSAMEINDTLQLSALVVPEGVTLVADDPDEVTIATLSPPRVEEEPEPAVEEETELVGEDGEAAAEDGESARATRATPAGSSPVDLSPPPAERGEGEQSGDRILIVGLGNPGERYAATRHNVGFEVAAELSRRWDLPKAKSKFGGLLSEGRAGPGGPRVAILLPQTQMNVSGDSAGPARGSLKVPLDRVDRPPRRDRPALRRGPRPPRRRPGRPQRPQEPQARLRRPRVLARAGRASAGPTRPIRRSSPPTCSAASASRAIEVAALIETRRRRDRDA